MSKPLKPKSGEDRIALINSLPLDVRLRFRDDAMPGAVRREFKFKGFEDGKVLLAPEGEEYTWAADIGDIDWDRLPKGKDVLPAE